MRKIKGGPIYGSLQGASVVKVTCLLIADGWAPGCTHKEGGGEGLKEAETPTPERCLSSLTLGQSRFLECLRNVVSNRQKEINSSV